jgi:chemotaxis response regulator CheB
VIAALPLIALNWRRFPLTRLLCWLLAMHALVLIHGGAYTYAQTPLGFWLRDAADAFGDKSCAIIFSGMAHDAIEGSKHVKAKGGRVWAQDPDTCVISSMVDGAREAGVVEFLGSPKQLADKMIAEYGKA